MDTTPNLTLPYIMAAQAQKHITHNEAIRALDALLQLMVLDRDLASPPTSPANGDRYIVAASPTGAWAGEAGRVAAYEDRAWDFYVPKEGWLAWVADENLLLAHDGTAWSTAVSLQNVPMIGINATADTTNRLAVKSTASLFDNIGNGHQHKINKAAAADTASMLFQTGYSGRAEVGTTGDDNLHIKVSADGSSWQEAIIVDRASGQVTLPYGGPIVILATGQSNFTHEPSFTWSPPTNLKIWNWDGVDTHVGTDFAGIDGTKMNVTWRVAAEIARANPTRQVRLINISFAGQAISHWMTGTGAPDVYDNIGDNMTPALAAAGVSTIDLLLWWQGESDAAAPSTYLADFETVQARFQAETWFPRSTPVVVFGITNTTIGGSAIYGAMNTILQKAVQADPDHRLFTYPAALPVGYWDDNLHLTAAGYDQAGLAAANTLLRGGGRSVGAALARDPDSGYYTLGAASSPSAGDNSNKVADTAFVRGELATLPLFRNRLINGDFNVWLRRSTSIADDTYGMDRWYLLNQTGNITVGQGSFIQDGWLLSIAMTQPDASAKRWGIAQIIEGNQCRDLRGAQVTLSFLARCSASTNIRFAILEWTGTANTVTSDWVNDWTSATYTTGNFFTSTSTTVAGVGVSALTANTPKACSLTATLSSSFNNIAVLIWTESTQAQNVTLDIGNVQLEKGAFATEFDRRPLGIELGLCQRYYYKTYSLVVAPGTASLLGGIHTYSPAPGTSAWYVPVRFPVPMRNIPTITVYDDAGTTGAVFRGASGKTAVATDIGFNGATIGTADTTSAAELFFHYIAEIEL
jgi:hypothetical protein